MIKVRVQAKVNPTEDLDIVKHAVERMFPGNEVLFEGSDNIGYMVFEGDIHALVNFHYLIRQEKIIDTARTQMSKGLSRDGKMTKFIINKQVATVGHLNFPAQEEPLGSIEIHISTMSQEEMLRLFDWITPPTENGVANFELDITSV